MRADAFQKFWDVFYSEIDWILLRAGFCDKMKKNRKKSKDFRLTLVFLRLAAVLSCSNHSIASITALGITV